ncbi:hypothetical protein HII13_001387 [Brettanomyces bruxellensis]|nr:hypothetical protein HII13_001387 [Brettanomyces bruxellensis]
MATRQEEYVSDSGSDYTEYWIDWFLGSRGNEYFCDVDPEYILDRFNLTGLNRYVDKIGLLVNIITDQTEISESQPEETRAMLEDNAKFLYALVHARYIITSRGLDKMLEKYRNGDFGYCPRVNCKLTPLLPVGLSDKPGVASVKLYCPNCEDLYNPKSSRHASIDGAFFGLLKCEQMLSRLDKMGIDYAKNTPGGFIESAEDERFKKRDMDGRKQSAI